MCSVMVVIFTTLSKMCFYPTIISRSGDKSEHAVDTSAGFHNLLSMKGDSLKSNLNSFSTMRSPGKVTGFPKRLRVNHQSDGGNNIKQTSSHSSNQNSGVSSPSEGSTLSLEKLDPNTKLFHLILGNLPRNYTITDVKSLVEEAKPIYINPLEETRVFNIKFCHIVLQSSENVTYLIDKLNGFVICGEKLTAVEAKHLLEWKEKAL